LEAISIFHDAQVWAHPDFKWLSVECQYIVDKKMCHDIEDNAL